MPSETETKKLIEKLNEIVVLLSKDKEIEVKSEEVKEIKSEEVKEVKSEEVKESKCTGCMCLKITEVPREEVREEIISKDDQICILNGIITIMFIIITGLILSRLMKSIKDIIGCPLSQCMII